MKTPRIALVWFRNDLRLHDNEALHSAARDYDEVIPLYCFDPRHYQRTPYGFPKTGAFRVKFLLETVADLRRNLRSIGADLILREDPPETVIPELAARFGVETVIYQKEVTDEEVRVEQAVERALRNTRTTLRQVWGHTLIHLEDLPFDVNEVPPVYTQFRKAVEKRSDVRDGFPAPDELLLPLDIPPGSIPEPEQLNVRLPEPDNRAAITFRGGETAALERLNTYLWQRNCLKDYKETRNGLLGPDYSSKFSAWLANGSLSPRRIYRQVKRYEAEVVANKSTYWMIFELLWRDYFRFLASKVGNDLFKFNGMNGKQLPAGKTPNVIDRWINGRLNEPFVDANMIELRQTGFMSNRGRQNVASYFVNDLGQDWRIGAEYFESRLIDYDVASNWANWAYVAGVGADPRPNRYFNVRKQARQYDPDGAYRKHWLS